jgi:hypothetical protein
MNLKGAQVIVILDVMVPIIACLLLCLIIIFTEKAIEREGRTTRH